MKSCADFTGIEPNIIRFFVPTKKSCRRCGKTPKDLSSRGLVLEVFFTQIYNAAAAFSAKHAPFFASIFSYPSRGIHVCVQNMYVT